MDRGEKRMHKEKEGILSLLTILDVSGRFFVLGEDCRRKVEICLDKF